MRRTWHRFRHVAIAALAFGSTGVARAAPVTVTLNGHLTSVPSQFAGDFTSGELFRFSYTYDTAASNAGSSTNALYYYLSAHLDVGGGAFTVDAPAGAVFANGIAIVIQPGFDIYKVDATDGLSYSPGAKVSPDTLVQVLTQFSYGPSEFASSALLPGAPPYTAANTFSLQLRPNPQSVDGEVFIDGFIDNVTDSNQPIPEPSGLALLPAALLAAGWLRLKFRRS
jgi:hypothetical protein